MGTSGGPAVTPDRVMQLMFGYAPTLIVETALRNGIFDLLEGGPKTAEQLAAESGASLRGLRAILNALVGLQFLAKIEDRRYALTAESAAYLVSTKPAYLGGVLQHTGHQLMPAWLELGDVVRSGKPAKAVNQQDGGAAFFQEFVEALFPLNYGPAQALARELDLEHARGPVRVLDLAAGSGVWGIALAQASSQVTVTAVDWPGVLEVTRRVAARHSLSDRFSYIGGDLATVDFGTGYNVATLGHILHSEGEARSRELLRKTFQALVPGGTIAVAEFLVNEERTGPPMGVLFAVNMLLNTEDGDTYSFQEISQWLREAGFGHARRIEPGGPSTLIVAERP